VPQILDYSVIFWLALVILTVYAGCYLAVSFAIDAFFGLALKMGTLFWGTETIKSILNKIKSK
jgi:phosphate/sulfate permease